MGAGAVGVGCGCFPGFVGLGMPVFGGRDDAVGARLVPKDGVAAFVYEMVTGGAQQHQIVDIGTPYGFPRHDVMADTENVGGVASSAATISGDEQCSLFG
jgi:hypothetical protein